MFSMREIARRTMIVKSVLVIVVGPDYDLLGDFSPGN